MYKVEVLVPFYKKKGGIANVYKTLTLNLENNIEYFYINTKTNSPFLKTIIILSKYLRFFISLYKYDLIHFNPPINKRAFYRDTIFISITILFRKKFIVHIHGDNDDFYNKILNNKFLNKVFKRTFGSANKYILLGKVFINRYDQLGINCSKVNLLPNPVSKKYFSERRIPKQLNKKTIHLLFLSRIDKLKGTEIAIETFSILEREFPNNFYLNVCGDGPLLNVIKEMANSLTLQNIKFHGYLNEDEKIEMFNLCDLLLFTSYGEGLPVSILEAMTFGLPIISRTVGGIPDWVKNGENGYLTDSKSPEVFKNMILKLISNKELFSKMSANNIKVAKENFTPDKVKESLMKIYQEVLSGNSHKLL